MIIEMRIFPKDASNGLSYSKLLYVIDKTHPRIVSRDKCNSFSALNFEDG